MNKRPPDASDIARNAELLGWRVTATQAADIAEASRKTFDAFARATASLGFDDNSDSLAQALENARRPVEPPGEDTRPTPAAATLRAHRFTSLAEAAQALRARQVSSVELTQEAIDTAQALQARLNAFVRIDEESALQQARRCDAELAQGAVRGVLHGIPLAHKDMFYRRGQISTCGSRIREQWIAPETARVLERLDAAGAIQIGTLNMSEFAYGATGQNAFLGDARNPWNTDYITGGSSSGPAAAVAGRIVFGALGSDTAGSVRLPASICGLVGMKTTAGLVSRAGAMPLSHALDTVGPLTRTVADNALLLSVIAGRDAHDPATAHHPVPDFPLHLSGGVQGMRIGIPAGYFDDDVSPEVSKSTAAAVAVFRGMGVHAVAIDMPDLDAINAAGFLLTWGDVMAIHGDWMRTRPEQYTPQTRGRLLSTLAVTPQAHADAQRVRGQMLRNFCAQVFGHCDALLTPCMPFAVPRLAEVDVSGGPRPCESSTESRASCGP